MNKDRRNRRSISYAAKLMIKYAPCKSILYTLCVIMNALAATFKIYVIAYFIDSVSLFLTQPSATLSLTKPVLAFLAITIYEWFFPIIIQLAGAGLKQTLTRNVRFDITGKRAMLEYRHVENAETNDIIKNVSENAENRVFNALNIMANSLGLLVKITGVIFILFKQIWWAALAIILISIPMMTIAIKGGKQNYQIYSELARERRITDYLKSVLTTRDFVSEKTVFEYSDKVNEGWHKQYFQCFSKEMKAKRLWYMRSKVGGIMTTLLILVISIILLFPLGSGHLTIGFYISVLNGCMGLISSLTWQLPYYLQELTAYIAYTDKFQMFDSLGGDRQWLCKPSDTGRAFQSLEFKDVSFRYPDTDKTILDHVSFRVEQGKHYALVGINGAGKSTMIKLIAGMYSDYSGEILLNGKELRFWEPGEVKELFSIVFQDFARYAASLKDNILLGDINHFQENEKNGRLEEIIREVGLDELCSMLEQGSNTELGKLTEDSVDLSGGQWQRIAIARGELRKAAFMIMDEPTAALDPVSESRMYQKFSEMNGNRTVLFISHRLGSIKMADEIILLDNGKIECVGSHERLMKSSDKYAELYEKQRRLYKG